MAAEDTGRDEEQVSFQTLAIETGTDVESLRAFAWIEAHCNPTLEEVVEALSCVDSEAV